MTAAGRRHKGRRTHVLPEDADLAKIPRSFIIKNGPVSKFVKDLSRDLRQAYRPWTAINLKEKRRATLKDYSDVGGVLNISHMVVLRQRHERVYASFLRTKGGEGPSVHFRVLKYSLMRDIAKSQHKPRSSESDYRLSPLIVTHGFEAKSDTAKGELDRETLGAIKRKIFIEAFPSSSSDDPQAVRQTLKGVRRVILFAYTGDKVFEMRHFAILKTENLKDQFDLNRKVKRSPFKDEMKEEAVTIKKEEMEEDDKLNFMRKNMSLVELGPRLTMKLCNFQTRLASKLTLLPEELVDDESGCIENNDEMSSVSDDV